MSLPTALQNDVRTSCFDGYVGAFSASRKQRIFDDRPWEPDVSAIISALIDCAETAATDFLCHAAGHKPDRVRYAYHIVNASELPREALRRHRADGSGPCLVRPDFFVLRIEEQTGFKQIVVAVELKNHAWVNYVRCPAGIHRDYSNQLVCYPEGCWLNLDHPSATDVRYVWLAPRAHLTDAYIESKALRDDPEHLARLSGTLSAYFRQGTSWSTAWEKAALEDLIESIAPHVPGIGGLLRRWITS